MDNQIITGDCIDVLRRLPEESVQCCVTSPPYFGLRDYGVSGQIGLEASPGEYAQKMVAVFREVHRVLRNDGTLWLNLGDTYANDTKWGGSTGGKHVEELHGDNATRRRRHTGLKPKDLIGIPWRVAFALQDDGWWLRSDCIWHKPNTMPESVTDRPTRAHEYMFLLSKSERYFYDAEAIKEEVTGNTHRRGKGIHPKTVRAENTTRLHHIKANDSFEAACTDLVESRNKRTVWTIASQRFKEEHFATMPPKLVEPCILASSSPKACEHCRAPWERIIEREPMVIRNGMKSGGYGSRTTDNLSGTMIEPARTTTTGWKPTCTCSNNTGSGKCIILDPFMGAGTVALVALQHRRQYLGIEINPAYVKIAEERIATVQQHLWSA